jgi:hypothetical protein
VANHGEYRDEVNKLYVSVMAKKKEEEVIWKSIRDNVKPLIKYYHELSRNSVPKSKANYYKKADQEKEIIDSGTQIKVWKILKQLYKVSAETSALEHAYRTGVAHLENARQHLSNARELSRKKCQQLEFERTSFLRDVLLEFSGAYKNRNAFGKKVSFSI